MPRLGLAKIYAFDVDTHGFFFWNFRTELESKWDYQKAVALGWLPTATERASSEYAAKLDRICSVPPVPIPVHPVREEDEGSSSWVLDSVLVAVFLGLVWRGYLWVMSPDRRGYVAISSADPVPAHDSI